MTTLVIAFFQFGVAALVLGIPLFLMARRKGRPEVVRKFVIGAAGIGLFCGLIAAGSEQAREQPQLGRLPRDKPTAGHGKRPRT